MQRLLAKFIFFLFSFVIVRGQNINQNFWDSLPNPIGWVNDFENVLTPQEEKSLDSLIAEYEKSTSTEIAIISIPLNATTEERFDELTLMIANKWGVGKQEKNNGILIGFSNGYRRIRIQNGSGIEKKLSNDLTSRIIDKTIVPYFKNGNIYKGLFEAIQEIKQVLDEESINKNENIIYDSIPTEIMLNYEGDSDLEILGWSTSGNFAYIINGGGPAGGYKYFYISNFEGEILKILKFYGEDSGSDNSNISEVQLNNKCKAMMEANGIIQNPKLNSIFQATNNDFTYLENKISLLQNNNEFRIVLKGKDEKLNLLKQMKRETSFNPELNMEFKDDLYLYGLFFNPQDKNKLIVALLKVLPGSGFENAMVGKFLFFGVDLSKF
ncbi:MAG: TPM domain-containing protein [Bacteroidota bacterium]|jgi:uncharacterized protein